MKMQVFHEGDRSEYLAMYALSTVGLVTPVPRQSDYFKADLIVHMFRRKGAALELTGQGFSLQVKSNEDDIVIESEDQLGSFFGSALPFFVGVIEKNGRELKLYTTIQRFHMPSEAQKKKLKIVHGGNQFGFALGKKDNKLFLSDPVLTASVDVLDSKDETTRNHERKMFARRLSVWTGLDSEAIALTEAGLPRAGMPRRYVTNDIDSIDGLLSPATGDRNTVNVHAVSLSKTLMRFDELLTNLDSKQALLPLTWENQRRLEHLLKSIEDLAGTIKQRAGIKLSIQQPRR